MRYYKTQCAGNPYYETVDYGPILSRVILSTIDCMGEGAYVVRPYMDKDCLIEDGRMRPGTFEYLGGVRVRVGSRKVVMNDRIRKVFDGLGFVIVP